MSNWDEMLFLSAVHHDPGIGNVLSAYIYINCSMYMCKHARKLVQHLKGGEVLCILAARDEGLSFLAIFFSYAVPCDSVRLGDKFPARSNTCEKGSLSSEPSFVTF